MVFDFNTTYRESLQGEGMGDCENPTMETAINAMVNSDFFIVIILVEPKGGDSARQLRSTKKD